jgi:mono/diheme cytochrome c family protein
MRRALGFVSAATLVLVLPGCDVGFPAGRTPHREGNFLDMIDQPKQKPQRGDLFGAKATGMLEPPPGTVATGDAPYPFAQNEAELAGQKLVNPLPATPAVLAHGKFVFENVCITCHGPQAAGDGLVTALFPKPPSLMTQKIRDWPDGQIFHRPMRGQNSMPSHARQVDERDIWSVVHYIRKLQRELPVAPPPPAAQATTAQAAPQPATAPQAPEKPAAQPAAAKGGR